MGIFSVSVFKSPIAQPSVRWVNTYEIQALGAADPTEVPSLVIDALITFEASFLLDVHQLVEAKVSTWVPDGTPYNPFTFVTLPLTTPGVRDGGSELMLSLRDVVFARKHTAAGRNGKAFYRGALVASDVTNTTGEYGVAPAAGVKTLFDDAAADLFEVLDLEGVQMVLVGASEGALRLVTELSISGVRSVSRNHRWYNHAA